MTKSLRILFALSVLATLGAMADPAFADRRSPLPKVPQVGTEKQQNGVDKCIDYCLANNKTTNSQADCAARCEDYWSHHQG